MLSDSTHSALERAGRILKQFHEDEDSIPRDESDWLLDLKAAAPEYFEIPADSKTAARCKGAAYDIMRKEYVEELLNRQGMLGQGSLSDVQEGFLCVVSQEMPEIFADLYSNSSSIGGSHRAHDVDEGDAKSSLAVSDLILPTDQGRLSSRSRHILERDFEVQKRLAQVSPQPLPPQPAAVVMPELRHTPAPSRQLIFGSFTFDRSNNTNATRAESPALSPSTTPVTSSKAQRRAGAERTARRKETAASREMERHHAATTIGKGGSDIGGIGGGNSTVSLAEIDKRLDEMLATVEEKAAERKRLMPAVYQVFQLEGELLELQLHLDELRSAKREMSSQHGPA
ncbi:hypothetical protein CORC01_06617 [Colletotrichum orchidophilum]|uniref:Uncharacterized protein n=1 Tax=Colletotrichum orchidophilum TaxID=1209926 RepID=A0A1G4B9M7_9PEZI|nr:uncharacterized protein CORC01_06617 [Colletotrichum orchidophilum]OHE98103.1 hypothetical protein CORC01_06617 [Colletotrichum orchidophilum]